MGLWPNVQAWYPDGRAATARELKKYENKSAIRKPDGNLRLGGGDAHATTISTSQTPHCQVGVEWKVREGILHLDWEESGGPPVAPPTKKGFGSRLLQEFVVSDLDGYTKLDFDVSGVRCNITARL